MPDVFNAEILPKLNLISTLNLAQVSKWYRDAVSAALPRTFDFEGVAGDDIFVLLSPTKASETNRETPI